MDLRPQDVELPDFEDSLWDELAAYHTRRMATSARPRRFGPRRATPVLVAAAAAIAAVLGLTGLPGSDTRSASAAERVLQALDHIAAEDIVHQTSDQAPADGHIDNEAYYDQLSSAVRGLQYCPDGRLAYEHGQRSGPNSDGAFTPGDQRLVDHLTSTYADWHDAALASGSGESAAQALQEGLANGNWEEDGTEVVDGRELGRLRTTMKNADGSVDGEEVLLYDRETFRPVRSVMYPGTPREAVFEYEYLPRTPENLALLVTSAPDGYTQQTTPEAMPQSDCG
jgi:hypothetical protein